MKAGAHGTKGPCDGKCRRKLNRLSRKAGVRVKRRGKSPPPRAQARGHDKPYCGARQNRRNGFAWPARASGCLRVIVASRPAGYFGLGRGKINGRRFTCESARRKQNPAYSHQPNEGGLPKGGPPSPFWALAGRNELLEKFTSRSSSLHSHRASYSMRSIPLPKVAMSRKWFVLSFMTLAMLLVPVLFDFGMAALYAPCCYAVYLVAWVPLNSWEVALLFIGYFVFYGAFFYGLARLSFWAGHRVAGRWIRLAQGLVLVAVFSCSFIRAIKIADWGYGTGTYNFWEACARFSKTHGKRYTGIP